jgi:hypothetical protein
LLLQSISNHGSEILNTNYIFPQPFPGQFSLVFGFTKEIRLAIARAMMQFMAKKHLNPRNYSILIKPVDLFADHLFKVLR